MRGNAGARRIFWRLFGEGREQRVGGGFPQPRARGDVAQGELSRAQGRVQRRSRESRVADRERLRQVHERVRGERVRRVRAQRFGERRERVLGARARGLANLDVLLVRRRSRRWQRPVPVLPRGQVHARLAQDGEQVGVVGSRPSRTLFFFFRRRRRLRGERLDAHLQHAQVPVVRVRLRELAVGVAQRVVRVLRGRPEGVVEHVRAEKRRLGVREHQRLRRSRLAASAPASRRRDVPRREGGGRRRGDPPRGALPSACASRSRRGAARRRCPTGTRRTAPCVARQARQPGSAARLFAVEPELQREALREVLPRAGQARVPARARGSPGAGRRPDVLGNPSGWPCVSNRSGNAETRAHSGRTSARDAGARDARSPERALRTSRGSEGAPHPRLACSAARRTAAMARSTRNGARDGRAGGGGTQLVRRLCPRKSSGRLTLDAVSLPRGRSRPATCQRRSDAPDDAQGHRRARRRGGDVQGRTLELAHHAAREAPSEERRSRCVVSVVSS